MVAVVFTSCNLDSSDNSNSLNFTAKITSTSTVTSELSDTQAEVTTHEPTLIVTDTTKVNESTIIIREPVQDVNNNLTNYENILLQLNFYQQQYFGICKAIEKNGTPEEYAQCDGLFVEVASKVPQENEYYKRYSRIEPDLGENIYGYEEVPDDYFYNPITVYMQQYEKYDEFLNDLYANIKSQIPTEAFEGLKDSEIQWIKDKEAFIKALPVDENDRYALAYKAEITKYRCLLLMLYLDDTIS